MDSTVEPERLEQAMTDPDIVRFLEARIAEDEKLVRVAVTNATISTGLAEDDITWRWVSVARSGFRGDVEGAPTPQRVLAECEAKRNLIEMIGGTDIAQFRRSDEPIPISQSFMRRDVADGLLRIMAQPYADHPDFQPEWKLEQ